VQVRPGLCHAALLRNRTDQHQVTYFQLHGPFPRSLYMNDAHQYRENNQFAFSIPGAYHNSAGKSEDRVKSLDVILREMQREDH
jgi:hypothetical protein